MKQYLELLDHVLTHGVNKDDRTGTGTLTVFDYTMTFDLTCGFPLVTTKRLHIKSIIHELLWFIKGEQDITYLKENKISIWDAWADVNGWVGPIYGKQWRSWGSSDYHGGIDQIEILIQELKTNPNSRRHIVSAWNVMQLRDMALPPCHFAFQCVVLDGKLNMKVFLRSLDVFLGAPFDIASYALLQHMLCHITGYHLGKLVISSTDTHLYKNHIEQAQFQLTRKPYSLPACVMQFESPGIDGYTFDMLNKSIRGYVSHPVIKAPIAV